MQELRFSLTECYKLGCLYISSSIVAIQRQKIEKMARVFLFCLDMLLKYIKYLWLNILLYPQVYNPCFCNWQLCKQADCSAARDP
jgi:hypothetical protein